MARGTVENSTAAKLRIRVYAIREGPSTDGGSPVLNGASLP